MVSKVKIIPLIIIEGMKQRVVLMEVNPSNIKHDVRKEEHMKTEYAYGTLCTLLKAYDADAGRYNAEAVIASPANWISDANPVYRSAAELLVDFREKLDSRITPKTVAAALKRVIANVNPAQSRFQGIFPYDGQFVVCDGFRMIRLNADITSLPHVENKFDVDFMMRGVVTHGETLNLPSIPDLKAFLAEEKARKKQEGARNFKLRTYCLDGFIHVNPQYLLDMLEALPNAVAYRPCKPVRPIYFRADSGDGILWPVSKPTE